MAVLNGSNTCALMLPRAGLNPASSLLQRCKKGAKMMEVKFYSKGEVGVGGGIEGVGGHELRLNMGMRVAERRLVRVKCSGDSVQKVVGENSSNVSYSTINIKPSEELLDRWAKEPAPRVGNNAESEAVRRLFLWDAVPKKDEVQDFSIYEINERDRDSPCFLPFSLINVSKIKPASTISHHEGLMEALQNLWSTVSSTLSGTSFQHSLGDMVPFSNKVVFEFKQGTIYFVMFIEGQISPPDMPNLFDPTEPIWKLYDGSLQMRLGITAGLTMVIKAYPGSGQKFKKSKFFFPDHYEAMYTFYLGDMGHVSAQGPFYTFEDSLLTVTGGAGMFREAKGVIHLHNITPFKLFYTFHLRGIPELPRHLTAKVVEPNEYVQPCSEAALCKTGFTLPNYSD